MLFPSWRAAPSTRAAISSISIICRDCSNLCFWMSLARLDPRKTCFQHWRTRCCSRKSEKLNWYLVTSISSKSFIYVQFSRWSSSSTKFSIWITIYWNYFRLIFCSFAFFLSNFLSSASLRTCRVLKHQGYLLNRALRCSDDSSWFRFFDVAFLVKVEGAGCMQSWMYSDGNFSEHPDKSAMLTAYVLQNLMISCSPVFLLKDEMYAHINTAKRGILSMLCI